MARIREFNPDEVLEKAMHVFWIKGYRHTTLLNIVKSTGVGKKGLYNVFGNKHDLYIKAMEFYKCMQAEQLLQEIDKENSDIEQIKDLFQRALNFTRSELGNRGCLVCNAMAEFGETEPEIWKATSTHIDRFRQAIKIALLNSVKKNKVRKTINIDKKANFLTSVLQSLMLMSRAGTKYSIMEDTVELSLYTLNHR